jgi:hypothetical protein
MGDGISDAYKEQRQEWETVLREVPDGMLNEEFRRRRKESLKSLIAIKERELSDLKNELGEF